MMKTLKTEMRLKDGTVFAADSSVSSVTFDNDSVATVTVGERPVKIRIVNLHKFLAGYHKAPSFRSIENMSKNGIATTVTGKRVEPDGHGPDGSPSWMLTLGFI